MRCTEFTKNKTRCKLSCTNDLKTCHIHAPDCPICLDSMGRCDDPCRLSCGHVFHTGCIYNWSNRDNRCPCCRAYAFRPKTTKVYTTGFVPPIELIQAYLNHLYDNNRYHNHIILNFDEDSDSLEIIDGNTDEVIETVTAQDLP